MLGADLNVPAETIRVATPNSPPHPSKSSDAEQTECVHPASIRESPSPRRTGGVFGCLAWLALVIFSAFGLAPLVLMFLPISLDDFSLLSRILLSAGCVAIALPAFLIWRKLLPVQADNKAIDGSNRRRPDSKPSKTSGLFGKLAKILTGIVVIYGFYMRKCSSPKDSYKVPNPQIFKDFLQKKDAP